MTGMNHLWADALFSAVAQLINKWYAKSFNRCWKYFNSSCKKLLINIFDKCSAAGRLEKRMCQYCQKCVSRVKKDIIRRRALGRLRGLNAPVAAMMFRRYIRGIFAKEKRFVNQQIYC